MIGRLAMRVQKCLQRPKVPCFFGGRLITCPHPPVCPFHRFLFMVKTLDREYNTQYRSDPAQGGGKWEGSKKGRQTLEVLCAVRAKFK